MIKLKTKKHLDNEFWQENLDRYETSVCLLAGREVSSETTYSVNITALHLVLQAVETLQSAHVTLAPSPLFMTQGSSGSCRLNKHCDWSEQIFE